MSEFLIAGGNTSAQAREWAEQEGLEVRVPKSNQLFIDIDSTIDMRAFDENYSLVDAAIGIESYDVTPSRSKPKGKHIVVNLAATVSPLERCLLQAILGSDKRREGHSYCRIQEGDREPTLFFEKKA
jgi:hypothetical protein